MRIVVKEHRRLSVLIIQTCELCDFYSEKLYAIPPRLMYIYFDQGYPFFGLGASLSCKKKELGFALSRLKCICESPVGSYTCVAFVDFRRNILPLGPEVKRKRKRRENTTLAFMSNAQPT